MALDVWCRSFPWRPFFSVAPEDRGGQLQHGPASIWQLAEVMAIVRHTREATRSTFACELRAADSPRPLAFLSISAISPHAWFKAGQGCNSEEISCNFCTCGKIIEYFEALLTEDSSQRKFFRCFWSDSGPRCWRQQAKPLGTAFQVRRKVIKSVETKRKQSSSAIVDRTISAMRIISEIFSAIGIPTLSVRAAQKAHRCPAN